MSALTQTIRAALIQSLWQDAIVALVLWVALRSLKRQSANVRYVVSCAALALMVVWPVASSITLAAPETASEPALSQPGAPSGAAVPLPEGARFGGGSSPRAETSSIAALQRWVLPVWIVGVMLFSIRAVGAGAHAMLLARRGAPADPVIVDLVADLARRMGIARRVRVIASVVPEGPATLGSLRPLILVPTAAMLGLTPQQLEAVMAHELAHIRRHDYLVNIAQVLIETLFFYHPAVWWASRRIRDERELCCDDLAVRACGDPLCYAQALTSLARLPLLTPGLAQGAQSGPLVHRIQRLLGSDTRSYTPSLWPPALTSALVLACVALTWAQTREAQRFEVASVKPNRSGEQMIRYDIPGSRRFVATNVPLGNLIRFAYDVDTARLVGAPAWIDNERFDIVATTDRDIPTWTPAGPPAVALSMLRTLLAERFSLSTHTETRELPVYALVMARSDGKLGPRVSVSTADCDAMLSGKSGPQPPASKPDDPPTCGIRIGPGQMLIGGAPMSRFASVLAPFAQRLVVDRTGLTGRYNLQLSWTPQGMRLGGPPAEGAPPLPPVDPNGASLFASIQEQLGLKLEASRAPVEVVVIDRVERPTPD